MKKIFFQIVLLALVLGISSTFSNEVTLSVGPQYANQVWYNITNNEQTTQPLASWDIAFYSYDQNASIRINSGAGAKLWEVLGKTLIDFGTDIDTTGLTSNPERFVEWFNSDTTWAVGAFNRGRNGFENDGDFGWGAYNMSTHAIVGDKLFIYKSIEGKYYIIIIEDLIGGTYTFTYRLLDNPETATREFSKKSTSTKLFGYYSISADNYLDFEPLQDSWELLFTKYTAMIYDENGNLVPYGVMGALSNRGIKVAKVEDVPTNQSTTPVLDSFLTNISTIGHTWKIYDFNSGWSLVPDLSYFVIANNGEIYKIVFTSFGGSSTGEITFDNNWVETGVNESFETGNSFVLTPNIIEKHNAFDILLNANSSTYTAKLNIYSITGENILSRDLSLANGLNAFSIENNLSSGIYIVALNLNGKTQVQKLIVK